jgi:predicted aspartyl protease
LKQKKNLQKKDIKSLILGLILTPAMALSTGVASAQDAMTKAVSLFQKKDYQAASQSFRALADTKQGATAHYYLGLCYIQLGHLSHAKAIFERLVQIWPSSAEAKLATNYLNGPGAASVSATASEKAADAERDKASSALATKILAQIAEAGGHSLTRAEWEKLPQKTRIPIERAEGHLWVRAKINGRYCRVIFDTGASKCGLSLYDFPDLIPKEQLDKAKVVSVSRVYGMVPVKMLETEITIQDITRRVDTWFINESRCSVIGQNFFKEYSYQVDDYYLRLTKAPFDGDEPAVATKSGAALQAKPDRNDRFSLPFERLGDTMLVDITVNGHPIKACFDTGCAREGLVIHPSMHNSLGISGYGRGIGVADRVEVGHMTKMSVQVTYENGLSHPLIGPKVFNRGYTVDQQAKRIRFDY